ncbi:hypothetical protein CC78DRAFT_619320 [Lojkania enalia]|uniref:Uncharacterized protein n=1 Tax=Lojkania enalia TaxID=147567 RepID=A0A9P4MXP3_9PLEO|nr:hypothetical protein CC78DRAFT_619320 [Didymosphaeria enalia]
MKLSQVLFAASAAVGVLGSKGAGGWEAIFYYDIYRMDYIAHDKNGLSVAEGCEGTHKDGGCNFSEFIQHIEQKSLKYGKKGYIGKFNPNSIPKDVLDSIDKPSIEKASGIMDWCVTILTGSLESFWNFFCIEKRLGDYPTRVEKSINQVVLNRQKENAGNLVRDFQLKVLDKFNGNLPKDQPKLTAQTYTYTENVDGVDYDYDRFDSQKMMEDINKHEGISERAKTNLINEVSKYVNDYEVKKDLSQKGGSSGATHYRDITAAQAVQSAIKGGPEVCVPDAPDKRGLLF